MSKNMFTENTDIAFQLKKRIDFEHFFSLLSPEEKDVFSATTAEEYLASVESTLESFGEICAKISENAESVDRGGVKFEKGTLIYGSKMEENIHNIVGFNFHSLCISTEFGGFGAPFFAEMAGAEILNRACPNTAMNINWFASIARMLEKYGTEEIKREYIPKIVEGKWSGNMALTEPDCGSDLGAIKTYAEKQEDGSYKLYGTKRFISNGTGQLGIVLAKTTKATGGLKGLSIFLCPRLLDGKDNVKVLKLEEKLGLHASATAELAYDGSKAWLLGKENEGFHYMLDLMNESRIAVGYQSLGLMEATYNLAKNYADERLSWGKPISQHELIAEKLLDMEVELKATRSLNYQTSYLSSVKDVIIKRLKDKELPEHLNKKDLEKELAKVSKQLRQWTPLIKYWGAERAVHHARNCVQIHGGYGFVKDYRAEWWLRESIIYAIYEGTSQIQALMCVKDTLKEVVRNPRAFIEEAVSLRVKGFAETDHLKKKLIKLKQMSNGAVIGILIKLFKSNTPSFSFNNPAQMIKEIKNISRDLIKFDNLTPALLHAERLCEIKCYEALAECLVKDYETDSSRASVLERFLYIAMPRVTLAKSMIDENDPVIDTLLKGFNQSATFDETGS